VPEVLNTEYGPVTVTHIGDPSKPPCLAVPEVGLNHRTCFQALLAASGPHSLLLEHWRFVFVDPPGCQVRFLESIPARVGAPTLCRAPHPQRVLCRVQAPDAEAPAQALHLTLDKLALHVGEIISLLKLREVLGLGVGNGGWVLARCAAARPDAFCGLALISPSCSRAGWWEWAAGHYCAAQLQYHKTWTPGTKEHMARRLFAPATLELPPGGDADLVAAFARGLEEQVPPAAARRYLLAALSRPDLAPMLKQLRCRVLLLYGTQALYQSDCMALAAAVDKSRLAMVDVSGGVLLTEERPGDLLSPLQLFLTALQLEGFGMGPSLEVGV